MQRFRLTIKQLLIRTIPIAVVVAMIAWAATSWGPLNLVVLVGCVIASAAVLACVPFIPHRPFWAGLAGLGLIYPVICSSEIPRIERRHLPTDRLFQKWAADRYGPIPHWKTVRTGEMSPDEYQRSIDSFVHACHAITALGFGLLGGIAVMVLARVREARRWDHNALPERPLEEFLLPPVKVDPPLNSN